MVGESDKDKSRLIERVADVRKTADAKERRELLLRILKILVICAPAAFLWPRIFLR